MLTPLVIAMPQPMAEALGYPDTPIGFTDIVALANDPEGWAKFGHPEWGPFKLGKTNPNFSTSGLNFTVAEYYAATGKTERAHGARTWPGPRWSEFAQQRREARSCTTATSPCTFLNNWYRADARGTALTYASAVAVEEKSIIDYNSGNPDGELAPGEAPRPPKVPLVAIYPKEGTLFSDNPFIVLDADWVTRRAEAGGRAVRGVRAAAREPGPGAGVRLPARQHLGGRRRADRAPPTASTPTQPQNVLDVPEPAVLVRGARRVGAAAQGGAGAAA